ncbi:MAG: ribonuclease J [Sphingopyxis sp.]|nr:ribonuclease J [Sphingopyxis sp.]
MTTPGKELLFLALGGSGEIGMNLNLYGCDGKWLMVDLGVTFGNADYPGIDIIMPDTAFIEERRKDLVGIMLTHAHEDHIGAVAYLAADLDVPIYANRFTASIVARKLSEEGLTKQVPINIVRADDTLALGPFTLSLVQLAHSIPDMFAVVIDTPYGRVFHTGDWKLDDDPTLGMPNVDAAIRPIGDKGVLALVCDSTNVFNPEPSGSEGSVREGLLKMVGEAKGRVVVTTFASNAARIETLGEVATATGRQLVVAGRSFDRIIGVAQACGYLKDLPPLVDWDAAMRLPRDKVMVLATGGQGEPRAALARMAEGTHPIKLEAGDRVVYSSKQIPGNEIGIGRIMNMLAERGIETVTEKQAHIHVSGHPGREELAAMYDWVRPEIVLPVHGEMRHMLEQARFAKSCGIPQALVQKNGQVVRLSPGPAAIIDHVRAGRLILDGDMIVPANGGGINERRRLSESGHVVVAVNGMAADVVQRGLPVDADDLDQFLRDACEAAEAVLVERVKDPAKRREAIRLAVRRCATEWTGKKPVVDVLMFEG